MHPRVTTAVVGLLFFLSGASGLVYETAWTRLFQDLFGHSVHTTSAVLAAFMAGLGLGALLGGRVADRVRRPIRLYGWLEVGLAAVVVSSPHQVRLVDRVLPTLVGPPWESGLAAATLRWGVAFLLVMLPATLMGATLPVLTRGLTRSLDRLGRVLGGLYGINTLGAVAGVVAAGFWLIRSFGVVAAIRVGSGLSLAAGLAALAVSALSAEPVTNGPPPATGPGAPRPGASRRVPAFLVGVVFLCGFTALAYEIIWIRLFVFVVGSNILSFSTVLGTLLLALGLGSLLFGWLVRRRERHLGALGWLQLALGPSAGLSVLLFLNLDRVVLWIRPEAGGDVLQTLLGRAGLTGAAILLPGLLMGAVLPAASGAVRDPRRIGGGVGVLYAAGTAGNIAGSLLAGYLLVPVVGSTRALALLAGLNVALGLAVLVWRARALRPVVALAGAVAAAAVAWLGLAAAPRAVRAVAALPNPHATVREVHEGLRGTVTVYDVPPLPVLAANSDLTAGVSMGDGYRLIAVDGVDVAGTSPDLRTTQVMQAHIPLLLHGSPRRVLQVGFGSGKTTQEVLLHDPEVVHLVELNPDVVEEANRWFPAFASSGFEAFYADAKNLVRSTAQVYDVILNDSTYPGVAGSSQLYSRDHFRACRQRLAADGVLSTWLPVDLPPETFRLVLASFRSVFPECSFWLPANCWNKHGVLVGTLAPHGPRIEAIGRRQWPPAVRASLGTLGYDDAQLIRSMVVLGPEDIRELTEGAPVNSDDRPRLEYPARGLQVSGDDFWAETLRMILGRLGPPGSGGRSGGAAVALPRALRDCVRLLHSGQLALLRGEPDVALDFHRRAGAMWPAHPGPERLAAEIRLFRAQAAFEDGLAAAARGDGGLALESLGTAVRLAPRSAAARFELGRVLLGSGRAAEAARQLAVCRKLGTVPELELLLGDAYRLSGRPAEAEAEYRRFLADSPPRGEVLAALADAVLAQGRLEECEQLLARALALDGSNEAVLGLAERLGRQHR